MSDRPSPHDGQGDAMPCQCPACASPFVVARGGYSEIVQPVCEAPPAADAQEDRQP